MIVIIDYGMGNLGSIANMFKKVGAESVVTNDVPTIERASKLVLPGVGAFDNGMKKLNDLRLPLVLKKKVTEDKTPVLGICLGMQLLTKGSEEGDLPGLGWIDAETVKFRFDKSDTTLKIPHMGWNSVTLKHKSRIFEEMDEEPRFYFVHSYYVRCNDTSDELATTHYGRDFTSAIKRGNIFGMQFHPEKSHKFGMKVFKNFVNL
jgi:glutamine amidotransferase